MRRRITGLFLRLGIINRIPVNSRRRSGLETLELEAETFQIFRKLDCRLRIIGTGRIHQFANDDLAACSRSGRQNDRFCSVAGPCICHDALDLSFFNDQVVNDALAQRQIRLFFKRVLHFNRILALVGLRAQRSDGRSLARVQHSHLNVRFISVAPHFAAQSIDFANDDAFGRTANGRVAWHECHHFKIDRDQEGLVAHPTCRKGCFTSRMTRTDNDDVIIVGLILVSELHFLTYFPKQN